jgi:hypothetical protein
MGRGEVVPPDPGIPGIGRRGTGRGRLAGAGGEREVLDLERRTPCLVSASTAKKHWADRQSRGPTAVVRTACTSRVTAATPPASTVMTAVCRASQASSGDCPLASRAYASGSHSATA